MSDKPRPKTLSDLVRIFADWDVVEYKGHSRNGEEQELHIVVRRREPEVRP